MMRPFCSMYFKSPGLPLRVRIVKLIYAKRTFASTKYNAPAANLSNITGEEIAAARIYCINLLQYELSD